MDDNLKGYFEAIAARQEAIRGAISNLLSSLAGIDSGRKTTNVDSTLVAVRALQAMFSKDRQPGWLAGIESKLQSFKAAGGAHNTAESLMEEVFRHYDSIFRKSVVPSTPHSAAVDFEAIYQECHRESRIPQLFDDVAALLQQVIDSKQIDSVKAIRTLESLIALLKKNRDGTYFSSYTTFQVVWAGMRHIPFQIAMDIPVVAGFIRGINAAMEEIDLEWGHVRAAVQSKIRTQFHFELKSLGVNEPIDVPEPRKLLSGPSDDTSEGAEDVSDEAIKRRRADS